VNLGPDMGSRAVRPVPSTTALHEASAGLGYATEAHVRIVHLLLEKRADASALCLQGYTVLDYALGLDEQYQRVRDIDAGHESLFNIVDMLIFQGARWDYGTNDGDHINIADDNNWGQMKKLLQDKGALNSRVHVYDDAHAGPSEVTHQLSEMGASTEVGAEAYDDAHAGPSEVTHQLSGMSVSTDATSVGAEEPSAPAGVVADDGLAAQQQPPLRDQLGWRLQSPDVCGTECMSAVEGKAAVSKGVYDAAVAAGQLIVMSAETWEKYDSVLGSTLHTVRLEGKKARGRSSGPKLPPVDWHESYYRADLLEQNGFRKLAADKPAIVVVKQQSAAGEDAWFEVKFVYSPGAASEVEVEARDAMLALSRSRFKEAEGGTATRQAPRDPLGESAEITERGSKTFEGLMLSWGGHARRARGEKEKVPGRALRWADRYGPGGKTGPKHLEVIGHANRHARGLENLERALCPEGAAFRKALADALDSGAQFRAVAPTEANAADSSAFSFTISSGYAVEPHDDSGVALEVVSFVYPSSDSLPPGHEWLFAVGGCLLPLPTKPEGLVTIALRGKDVRHGTLGTGKGTGPHLHNHRGVGSALVTKKPLVDVLVAMRKPEQLPAPTREELQGQAELVRKGLIDAYAKALEKALQLQRDESAIEDLLQQAENAIGDPDDETCEIDDVDRDRLQQIRSLRLQLAGNKVDAACNAGQHADQRRQAEQDPIGGLGPLQAGGPSQVAGVGESDIGLPDPETIGLPHGLPQTIDKLLKAIEENDFGKSFDRGSDLAAPAMLALKKEAERWKLPVAATHTRGMALVDGYFVLKAPRGLKGNALPSAMLLVSTLTRLRLLASNSPLECIPFGRNKFLITEAGLVARRRIAKNHTPKSLTALREKPGADAQQKWERLQQTLSASGISVCPASGAPVHNLQDCSEEWKEKLFELLLALSEASNGKTGKVEAAMKAVASVLVSA